MNKSLTDNTMNNGQENSLHQTLRRFTGGLRIPTVSSDSSTLGMEPFDAFKKYLPEQFPLLHSTLESTTINTYGLAYRWKGKNPQLAPLLLLSHYDVVPATDNSTKATEGAFVFRPEDVPLPPVEQVPKNWQYPPFSGTVADGRIYGRGALDMKCMLFSILEAITGLIEKGFVPERDIWLAFGHDEESGGQKGARQIAGWFQEKGMVFDAIYDEGGLIATDGLMGLEKPVALVGTCEKGFLTVRIRIHGSGGHSSMPPAKSTLVLAAEIIRKLNDNQLPLRLTDPTVSMVHRLAGQLPKNSPALDFLNELENGKNLEKLGSHPVTNALFRTTTAITMARGSEASNVLSPVAEITVNFRLLPGDTLKMVLEHVHHLCSGYEVEIEPLITREASRISPENTRGFDAIRRTLSKIFPDTLVLPYITIGGTDSQKYEAVSRNIYRFMPVAINAQERGLIHNNNEYISIQNYLRMIRYFQELIDGYDQ